MRFNKHFRNVIWTNSTQSRAFKSISPINHNYRLSVKIYVLILLVLNVSQVFIYYVFKYVLRVFMLTTNVSSV